MIWSKEKIKRYAKGFRENGQAFFYYKQNADRFAQEMRARGYTVQRIRSSGPNVERISKKGAISYGVLIGQRRKITTVKKKSAKKKIYKQKRSVFGSLNLVNRFDV